MRPRARKAALSVVTGDGPLAAWQLSGGPVHSRGQDETGVIMTAGAFRRVEPHLAQLRSPLRPLLFQDGALADLDGRDVSCQEARPEIGWAGSEVFIDRLFVPLAEMALRSPRLAWFQSGAAGTDHPLFARFGPRCVRVTTCDAPADAVADLVMAGVLDHFQGSPERRAARAQRRWQPQTFREIGGSSWLLVGFGAIGQRVARRARAFGARITGVSRRGCAHPLADEVATPDMLHELLPGGDVVVLCLPLEADTAHLVDSEFLSQIKADAVLVNVGRGGLVDEAALLAALDRGRPAHAILDVFAQEPLPNEHPFWTHERISLTSHLAGMGSGLVPRSDALFVDNLGRFLRREPLLLEKQLSAHCADTGMS